jgi:hypothetical protein
MKKESWEMTLSEYLESKNVEFRIGDEVLFNGRHYKIAYVFPLKDQSWLGSTSYITSTDPKINGYRLTQLGKLKLSSGDNSANIYVPQNEVKVLSSISTDDSIKNHRGFVNIRVVHRKYHQLIRDGHMSLERVKEITASAGITFEYD